jgi:DNA polymerase-3 subunit alpha
MPQFSHLHCHTQFSLLDGASNIKAMMAKAKANDMKAVALTDHGNMFGAFQFVMAAEAEGIKPIVGCEFYVVEDRFRKSFGGGEKDKRYHQLILAKNKKGYENISKLCSLGFIEGLYSKYPRIDKSLIRKYSEGLIATTCCIGAEVPQAIVHKGEEEAEKIFKEWHEIFGNDYYIELQRHNLKDIDHSGLSQEDVNQVLLKFSRKYNVPAIATNDSHYLNEEDSNAHDILLCVNTGDLQATPIGDGKGYRFGFPNSQFFFKTQEEMGVMFQDLPFALDNTNLIIDSIETPKLKRDILLPNYIIPKEFDSQITYLRTLTYNGALKRYGEITESLRERLDYELGTIERSSYQGYFLIVQDFTSAARDMGVSVGPGRGSAAGSVVAYCLGITNVDPIKYSLLFERFLNPERVSFPDIDIDFDDIGRSKVINYVLEKYGKMQVAQIITYGSMAAKSSIRDVARVLDLPLKDADRLSKMVPDISLAEVFDSPLSELKSQLRPEQMEQVNQLRAILEKNNEESEVLKQAKLLEGSVRNTGVHACGIIITPDDITNYIPMALSKDSDLLVTQYDNDVVEKVGMLKMDFLGLKTLSILNTAIKLIEERHEIKIIPDLIDLEDSKTYDLFQQGKTVGIFQFESDGMQKHLKDLKPNRFEDLIAMNALYRPGPMAYIPKFVKRKHGKEPIEYDDPDMSEILSETYGITVYQEQVMLLSEKLGGLTKGQADTLRKAMGKKDRALMDGLKKQFMEGCLQRNRVPEVMDKVWKDWEAFAEYAFNKSHATCYAVIAFQTAFLKANYPAEFMAAVLTHNMSDIKKIGFFMDECRSMNISVLGPDVNESRLNFSVNREGAIRFGLAAVKGVGEACAEELMHNRTAKGNFASIFDLTCRVNLRSVNKKSLESLALAGAFDSYNKTHRAQYVNKSEDDQPNGIELAIKFGTQMQGYQSAAQTSLFGSASSVQLTEPQLPKCPEWSKLELLHFEKEMLGIYISGHPLDSYKLYIDKFCNFNLGDLNESKELLLGKEIRIAGIITKKQDKVTKEGKSMGIFTIEDYRDQFDIVQFSEDYAKFKGFFETGSMLLITGKCERSFYKPEDIRFCLTKVIFLADIKEKLLKNVTIKIPVEYVNDKLIQELQQHLKQTDKGVNLKINLVDDTNKIGIRLTPRKMKLEFNNELVKKLDALGLEFEVNQ